MNRILFKILFLSLFLFHVSPSFSENTKGFFKGAVLDRKTDKPLPGVTVKMDPSGRTALTDENGAFEFKDLELSTYSVQVSLFGYETVSFDIDLLKEEDRDKAVFLVPSEDIYLKEVVVRRKKRKIEGTKQVLRVEEIKNTSTSLFNDTMATLQKMPGVSGNEFSGVLYIRGGTPWENIALMDDVMILWPYHWGGHVSIFNPEMVEKVDFYTGGFPAIYSMATSGIIDVKIKKGNFEQFKGFFDLSVTGATLSLESPVNAFQRSSFILGARRTHYDLIMNMFTEREGVVYPFFDDIHIKLYSEVNPRHSLSYNTFFSSEGMEWELSEEDASDSDTLKEGDRFNYGTKELINSIQWEYAASDRLKLRNTLSHDYTKGFANAETSEPIKEDTVVHMFQFRNDWDLSLDEYNSLSFGYFGAHCYGDVTVEGFTKETKITGEVETTSEDYDFDGSFVYHGLYLQDEFEPIKDDLTLSGGLRYETFGLSEHTAVSPRAGLKKKILKDMFLNLGWGLFYRYETNIKVYDEDKGNKALRPERAVHYLLGLENRIKEGYLLKNDFFYKDYRDIVTEDPVKNYINGAEGYSYGLETILQKESSEKLSGWVSYTYAVARRRVTQRSEPFDPYNDPNREIGEWYYPDFDQRHTLSCVADYELSPKWSFYLGWDFHTGRPYTGIAGAYRIVNEEGSVKYLPIKEEYNEKRLPSYHKLDLKIINRHKLFGLRAESYLEFINLYGKRNVYYYYYDTTYTKRKSATYFPFLVVGGIKVNF